MNLFGPSPSDETMRSYTLDCIIHVKRNGHIDYTGKNDESSIVLLIPKEGSARDRFLNAWAPVGSEAYHEVLVDGPFGVFRAAVHRPDMRCDQYYLFVMSGGAEALLKNRWRSILSTGQDPTRLSTSFTILPEAFDGEEAQPMEVTDLHSLA